MNNPKDPPAPPDFAAHGVMPGVKVRVAATAPGARKLAILHTGTVISVHPNFAVIRTSRGYRVTITRFDLGRVRVERREQTCQ